MPMAGEMTSLLKTILLKSVDKKILKIKNNLKINLIIINQAIRKCLNKPRILVQFIEKHYSLFIC